MTDQEIEYIRQLNHAVEGVIDGPDGEFYPEQVIDDLLDEIINLRHDLTQAQLFVLELDEQLDAIRRIS